jgi:hypothetical protein
MIVPIEACPAAEKKRARIEIQALLVYFKVHLIIRRNFYIKGLMEGC